MMRYVIGPVDREDGIRWPRVARLEDIGRPRILDEVTGKWRHPYFEHRSILGDGIGRPNQNDRIALSLVRGNDFFMIDNDRSIQPIVKTQKSLRRALTEPVSRLDRTEQARLLKIFRRFRIRGLTREDPLWVWCARVIRSLTGRIRDPRRELEIR